MSEPPSDPSPPPAPAEPGGVPAPAAERARSPQPPIEHAEVQSLERPHPNLIKYYLLQSLMLGPFFPFALVPLYFKYHTLRYRFDEQGVSMRWGILFRREISLNYSRIQDIHLASNIVERWLGLGRVQVQTASGAAAAEMTIEGLREYEAVRDYLYSRMRGARQRARPQGAASPSPARGHDGDDGLAAALREVAAELAAVRRALEAKASVSAPATPSPAASAGERAGEAEP